MGRWYVWPGVLRWYWWRNRFADIGREWSFFWYMRRKRSRKPPPTGRDG